MLAAGRPGNSPDDALTKPINLLVGEGLIRGREADRNGHGLCSRLKILSFIKIEYRDGSYMVLGRAPGGADNFLGAYFALDEEGEIPINDLQIRDLKCPAGAQLFSRRAGMAPNNTSKPTAGPSTLMAAKIPG